MTTLLFSLLTVYHFPMTSEGNLHTLPRADPPRDAIIGQPESLPNLSPRGWKFLCLPFQPPLQLRIVMSQLGRKATGGFWESFHFPEKETRVVRRLPLPLKLNAHVTSKANPSPYQHEGKRMRTVQALAPASLS